MDLKYAKSTRRWEQPGSLKYCNSLGALLEELFQERWLDHVSRGILKFEQDQELALLSRLGSGIKNLG